MLKRVLVVSCLATALCLTASFAPAADWGDLTGKFVYNGKAPEPKPLNIDADANVFGKLKLVDESLVVDKKTGAIANIVIYVRTRGVDVHPDIEKKIAKKVTFDNKGGKFVPRILPVWIGKQKLVLANSDSVPHNSNIQAIGDVGINPLLPAGAKTDHPGFNISQIIPVTCNCNIHKWMTGYVLPRDNPYMAVTAKDGTFTLKNLPAGKELEFQAWHERVGYLAQGSWTRGRFKQTLKAGAKNDLGTIKVDPKLFEKE